MTKRYMHTSLIALSSREASGHSDVVVKYNTFHNKANITWLHPELGCSVQNNVPTEQCPECQEILKSRCAICTCQDLSMGLTLASCGILGICLFPFWYGPKCSFIYITESAASAVLTLTGGLTSSGPPVSGQSCYVFGRQTQVVEDKSGGTYSLSPMQMLPISIAAQP